MSTAMKWIQTLPSEGDRASARELADSLARAVQAKDWKQAHVLAFKLTAIAPTLEAVGPYALSAFADRKLREGIRVLQECTRLKPDQPAEFWDLLGCFLLDMGESENALSAFKHSGPSCDRLPAICVNGALGQYMARNHQEAVTLLRQGARMHTNSLLLSHLMTLLTEGEEMIESQMKPLKHATPITIFPCPYPALAAGDPAIRGQVHVMESPLLMEFRLNEVPAEPNMVVEWRKLLVAAWSDDGLHLQFGTVVKSISPTLMTLSLRKPFKRFQRRKFKRIPVKSGVKGLVVCKEIRTASVLDLIDLSAGGCQINFPISVPKGTLLNFDLIFEVGGTHSEFNIPGLARSVRGAGKQFILTVEFQIDPAVQARLETILTQNEFALRRF